MDKSLIEHKLSAFVAEELLADQTAGSVHPDTPLFGSGGVDSLAIMRLVMFIERELGTTVPLADLTPENFASIEVLSAYLGDRHLRTGTG